MVKSQLLNLAIKKGQIQIKELELHVPIQMLHNFVTIENKIYTESNLIVCQLHIIIQHTTKQTPK